MMKNKKLWIFLALVVVILLCNHIFGWSDYVSGDAALKYLHDLVKENLVLAVLIYIVASSVGGVLLAIPGVTFAIIAGVVFGPVQGTLYCLIASTLGAMAAFLVGRFFLQDSIKPLVMKNKYIKKWLFDESGKNEVLVLLITRMVPVFPYNLQNFAYGVTDISFRSYSVYSFLFMLPGTAMYTFGTAGIVDEANRGMYIAVAAVLAIAVFGIAALLKRRYDLEEKDSE